MNREGLILFLDGVGFDAEAWSDGDKAIEA